MVTCQEKRIIREVHIQGIEEMTAKDIQDHEEMIGQGQTKQEDFQEIILSEEDINELIHCKLNHKLCLFSQSLSQV